jgi:hypothetical protein
MAGKPQSHIDEDGRECLVCLRYKVWELYGKESHGVNGHRGICIECARPIDKIANARSQQKLKLAVMAAYGGSCVCCGESEIRFLTIDHVDGDGASHRRATSTKGGPQFYRWLRKNNYPGGFQLLCWNCNAGRYFNGGICPHQEEKWQGYLDRAIQK